MGTSVTIRMYRLDELGDCFLLTFADGGVKCRMLIDCGSFRNSRKSIDRLKHIVGAISAELGGDPLDVVVGTHQHNDHLSGFVHCEAEFRAIGIEEVWLSWLDDPADQAARAIGEDHNNLMLKLAAVSDRLHRMAPARRGARALGVLDDMLGFYGVKGAGAPPQLPAGAVAILKEVGREKPKYLRPGQTLDVPRLAPGQARVHVLGPPRIAGNELLYRKDPRQGESYDPHLAFACASADRFLDAVNARSGVVSRGEVHYPFSEMIKASGRRHMTPPLAAMQRLYNRRTEAWRKIDEDWLQQADTLALFLDTFTNNSSLVLAIELMESRKVLLFVADAQTGNWLSWDQIAWGVPGLSRDDLLARTVYYKVGHHASHNATLVASFEKMTNPDLVACIPVHKKDPNITKENGWKMPARNLFRRLKTATANRVLQMDGVNPPSCNPTKGAAKAAWRRAGITPKITADYIEVKIVG